MGKKEMIIILSAVVLIALIIAPYASSSPDGLERVAQNKGFIEKERSRPVLPAPAPGYNLPGIKNQKISTAIAVVLGTTAVFGLAYGLALVLRRPEKK